MATRLAWLATPTYKKEQVLYASPSEWKMGPLEQKVLKVARLRANNRAMLQNAQIKQKELADMFGEFFGTKLSHKFSLDYEATAESIENRWAAIHAMVDDGLRAMSNSHFALYKHLRNAYTTAHVSDFELQREWDREARTESEKFNFLKQQIAAYVARRPSRVKLEENVTFEMTDHFPDVFVLERGYAASCDHLTKLATDLLAILPEDARSMPKLAHAVRSMGTVFGKKISAMTTCNCTHEECVQVVARKMYESQE